MYRILIAAMLFLLVLACEEEPDQPAPATPTVAVTTSDYASRPTPTPYIRAPTPVRHSTSPTPTPYRTVSTPVRASAGLGVSASRMESLFEKAGYEPFDTFGPDERAAMFFDGGGGAVMLSLFGPQNNLESIEVNFSNLNQDIIVALTVSGLVDELAPQYTEDVAEWLQDNYPTGPQKKTGAYAGDLKITLVSASFGKGWQAAVTIEPK